MAKQPANAAAKKAAVPVVRTARQEAALAKKAKADADLAAATRLAQIVNLHIAGMSLGQIGAEIGATADEVDRMIQSDAARYVRTQPQLRVFVRNYVSGKYSELLAAIWDDAVDMTTNQKLTVQGFDRKLASQDRAIKILERMAKLHGADAPTQTEVKVEAAPEAVDKLVQVLSMAQGHGYDMSVFDVVDAEEVHEVADEAAAALKQSSEHVGDVDPANPDGGFQKP
jgi:hypothetical protein